MYWVYVFFTGLAAGWMGGQVTRGKGLGLIGNLVTGIIGSIIGGIIHRMAGIEFFGLIGLVLSAFTGAVLLLWLLNFFKK